ncbi:MAG: DUF4263 domain-containing protein [Lysobacteraceae bacterium]|nr:MAG: DUF4263 domain-containing protein [Xanthomonadaceae bacterium]
MKISDFIFRYTPYRSAVRDSLCRVRVFHSAGTGTIALLTDLGHKNPGQSVANSIESLHRALIDVGHIPSDAKIIEHYEDGSYRGGTYDIVTINNGIPDWKSITQAAAAEFIGCDEAEISCVSLRDERLARQVESLRIRVDPHIDRPWVEPLDVINRRNEILRRRVPVQQLRTLIEKGAGESELHTLIKSDLSLIGEIYAQPDDEYIAFSEFPLNNGRVDFVLFSGRSRLDVTLIEIKGADFNLTVQNGYMNLNAKFNEARQQITSRLGYVYRNYHEFRPLMHKIRQRAENGDLSYSAFPGPISKLGVDPNKDVNVQYVVIGGRTTDDERESRLRHEFEMSFNPRIRLESWDTWIRKLRRI